MTVASSGDAPLLCRDVSSAFAGGFGSLTDSARFHDANTVADTTMTATATAAIKSGVAVGRASIP